MTVSPESPINAKSGAGLPSSSTVAILASDTSYLDERKIVCPVGSFIFVPQGARHGFRTGDVPSRKLNFYFPASMIGYFDDLAGALQREGVSDAELAEIAEAHSMEIVGPPSESYV
jgi:hypothetical protein